MKLVISNGSRSWGGGEAMAEMLARGLQQRGHEVVVFCRSGSALEECVAGRIPAEPILGGFDLNPGAVLRCMRALRRHRTEAVIINTIKEPRVTGVAARLLGIPVIFRQEIDQPYKRRLRYRLFYGWVPTRHVVVSEATRRTILASVHWLSPEEVVLIPNGIDAGPFLSAEPLDLGLPSGAVALGFVGRLHTEKGIRELAEAWPRVAAAVPEAHLVIAGSGFAEGELRGLLASAPRVHWLGFRSDVPSLMKAIGALVLPSHSEGFGLVVVEAMAAGTPVIASRVSSLHEIVQDGVHGRLVPSRDAERLAEAMIEIAAASEERRRSMGEEARARVLRDFTFSEMLDRHEALLAEMISSRKSPISVRS